MYFVQDFYWASFSCFWYRIQWNDLALDMEFSKATIAVLGNVLIVNVVVLHSFQLRYL